MLHCGIKENNVLKTRNKIILSRERNRKYVKDDVGVCRLVYHTAVMFYAGI